MSLGIVSIDAKRTRWRATGEALAVLTACMASILFVGAGLVLLLAPRYSIATFDLVRAEGSEPLPHAELLERVRALGLTEDVRIEGSAKSPRLILGHLSSTATVGERVDRALVDAGYSARPFRVSSWPDTDPQAVMGEHPGVLLGAQSIILLLFGFVFGALRVRQPFLSQAGLPRALLLGAGVGLLGFLASAGIGLIQEALGLKIQEQAWLVDLLGREGFALRLLPWIVLLAPCAEEVFFRGYMFRFLDERAGGRVAYPLSAACFSLIHFNPTGVLVYFVVGLLFAWACRRTATLAAAVAAHVVYNGVAFGIALLQLSR
jgi:membrane protease YdiL (CAAX protease family)